MRTPNTPCTRLLRLLRVLSVSLWGSLWIGAALGSVVVGSGWANASAAEAEASGKNDVTPGITGRVTPGITGRVTPEITGRVTPGVVPKIMVMDGARVPVKGKKLYSQFNEELVIRHFFQDQRAGFFLDVGSWDWKMKSTTLYLEKHLGWSGIAIDALPEVEAGYREHRPGTKFYHRIVTDHSGALGKIYRAGELTSTNKSHIDGFPGAEERVKKIYGEFGSVDVRTATLNEILDENGVRKINFLSMDIEGGEPAALAGFDIDRFQPDLICIEATQSIRKQISAYFRAHGYERIEAYLRHDRVNWYYRPMRRSAARASDD